MRKFLTKIICLVAAVIAAVGLLVVSACSNVYKAKPLSGENIFTEAKAESNGGFVVEKGDYIYFINGRETNTADNTFGSVVKGAIMRISKKDLAARNYSSVDTVVPLVVYSGNANAGIYIYGDYIYYSTPSTEKNSNGEVLNDRLAFNRTKLDGTDTNKDYFIQHPSNSYEYRYVEVDGVVYLLYVATSENLYGTSCTNLHSLNTQTGVNTLLAYNVSAVTFDSKDVTNPRVYYTMKVPDFVSGATSTFSSYNQIYTVTADATTSPRDYKLEDVDGYDASKNPLYVNCGDLVYDGIGFIDSLEMTNSITQFNGDDAGKVTRSAYTYEISRYENGTLFYTLKGTKDSYLFAEKESVLLGESHNPVLSNPATATAANDACLSTVTSSLSSYNYIFNANGDIDCVLVTDGTGIIKANIVDGKIAKDLDDTNRYYITDDGQATVLFTAKHGDNNYIYYSLTGGNGYTVHRVCYGGSYEKYANNRLPLNGEVNEYVPVQVLDLDASSDWYKPELIENQIIFPSQTENMTSYTYIMACDLRGESGVMTNKEIDALTEKYNGIEEAISDIDESVYENLQDALKYGFYTNDATYLNTLIKAYVDVLGYDEEKFWSKESVEKYADFIAAKGDWSEYADTKTVNGVEVTANKRDYYYSVLGKMNGADAESYSNNLKTTYLESYPEKEVSGFASWSKGAQAGLIIGVIVGGLALIAAVVVVTLIIIRKKKSKLPTYKKKRIKVDTTDDKNIDVYSDGESKKEDEKVSE
ncbi:MAG: hypothetical protein K2K60_03835 [Clostridia bacterium]|nr:hypothetical protein [Clostridia bacterium]